MVMKGSKQLSMVLIAMSNGEIRMYNNKTLITTIKCDDAVKALTFGSYGWEEGSLIIVQNRSGGLTIKMLQW